MNNPTWLDLPSWVPAPIVALARPLYAEAVARPPEFFGMHAAALRRAATDTRMKPVWIEIYRRAGGAPRGETYVHPAQAGMVRAHHFFKGVEAISERTGEYDRVQDQAAAEIFLVATGNPLWDRRYGVGPRTRTRAEIEGEIAVFLELADHHEQDATKYERLGDWRAALILRNLAAETRRNAENWHPSTRSPWVVERRSDSVGDEWVRGFIIELAQIFVVLFGKKMLGCVAILANVILDRNDITVGKVQGVVKHLS